MTKNSSNIHEECWILSKSCVKCKNIVTKGPGIYKGCFEGIIMNKKLLALLAVAAVGVSVAGATPQTQFNKGEFQVDLGAAIVETKTEGFEDAQNGTLMVVWLMLLSDKTAVQYGYHGLKFQTS